MSVEGIDLSGWNKPQDWSAAKAAGVEFCFVKVSEGTKGSRRSDTHHRDLGAAGIWRGAYHFAYLKYKGKTQPREQCENMVREMEAIGQWELPPVLDMEWQTYPGRTDTERKAARVEDIGRKSSRFPASAVVDWALEFSSRCVELTGTLPILYTGKNFWKYRMGSADLSGWILWEVDYIDHRPEAPAFKAESKFVPPWPGVDFWQWSGRGKRDWYKGSRIDLNLYNGTLEEFRGAFG
jgi:lysozyme